MADILIRGIGDIPVGQEFVIVENIDFERYLYNRETGAAFHLISFPEGHGRLIDETELIAKLVCHCKDLRKLSTKTIGETIGLCATIVPAEGGGEDGNA